MSSVDSRIVTMKFDNAAFEKGVSTTLTTMGKLKQSLAFSGASKGLDAVANTLNKFGIRNPFKTTQSDLSNLQSAENRFSMQHMEGGVTSVSKKFVALTAVAVTAISNITSRAIDGGLRIAKAFTLDPITAGFHNYETQINAVQTILANTQSAGTKLKDVNKALAELNVYANKTVYNFSDMAKNIGTFTAAGVSLKTSVASIKGISNLAALSGSSADQASTAMYQLSQAIASGSVKLQDWNSVVNAGLGGKTFQNALEATARAQGVDIDAMIKKQGSFRNTLKSGWLTSGILTKTLDQFTGDLTEKQLKAMGYSDKEAQSILKMGKTANDAATKIKTFTQLTEALKEEIATQWAATFKIIFGNIKESTRLFSKIHTVLENAFTAPIKSFNKLLAGWAKLGGRSVIIDAISNAFKALGAIMKPIGEAFREVFPPTTAKHLYDISVAIDNFTKRLIIGKKTSDGLKATFAGLFAALHIYFMVLKGVVSGFVSLIGILSGGSGSIFNLTGSIGDLLVKLDAWLSKGDKIQAFFNHINAGRAKVLVPVVALISKILDFTAQLIRTGSTNAIGWLSSLAPMAKNVGLFVAQLKALAQTKAEAFIKELSHGFSSLGPILSQIGGTIKKAFASLRGSVSGVVGGLNLGSIFDIGDKTSVAAAGVKSVGSALKSTSGVADRVKDSWSKVVDAFAKIKTFLQPVVAGIKTVFSNVKAQIMQFVHGLGIQDGLAVLNTGFFIAFYVMLRKFLKSASGLLSSIKETYEHIGGVFKQLTSNLKTMQKSVRASIILKIAAALLLLSVALFILAKVPANKLATSLGAVATLMALLVVSMRALEKDFDVKSAAKMTVLSVALIGLGVALIAMSVALAILGRMKISTIAKGLTSIALILGIVVAASTVLSKTGGAGQILVASAALGVLALSLLTFAAAIKLYSAIDTKTIVSGGLKVAAVILAVGLAMRAFPSGGSLGSAAALLVVSGALLVIAGVLKIFAAMSVGSIAKSLLVLAGAMVILGLAMVGMEEGLPGSAALLVMAAALAVLVPPLILLGHMSLKEIGIALLVLVGVFVVLGAAAAVIGPLAPVLVTLAGAIALLGLAALAVGAGMLAFSAGLATLAVSGAAGAAALGAVIIAVAETFPLVMQQIGLGIRALAAVISGSGPIFINAMVTVLTSLFKAINKVAPRFGHTLVIMINTGLSAVRKTFPRFVQTGFAMLLALLNGVKNNIGRIVGVVTSIIVRFLNALSNNMPRITKAGANLIVHFINGVSNNLGKVIAAGAHMIVKFVNGVTNAINKNAGPLGAAGGRLGVAVVRGMVRGILNGISSVASAAAHLASSALSAAKHKLGIKSPSKEFVKVGDDGIAAGMIKGIDNGTAAVSSSAEGLAQTAVDSAKKTISKMTGIISDGLNTTPTIAPVLDLTDVNKGASKMGLILAGNSVKAGVSYSKASSISADTVAAQEAINQGTSSTANAGVSFTQNNYSPKALSAVDIYRKTRNQISLAKGALNK